MYYLVENITEENKNEVIQFMDEDEAANINVNLPDEDELSAEGTEDTTPAEDPSADTNQEEETPNEDVPAEESIKKPNSLYAKFEMVSNDKYPAYECMPNSNKIIVGTNLDENINVIIHGMCDGKYYVTTESSTTSYDDYRQARVGAIRETVIQHRRFLEGKTPESEKILKEIYESCKDEDSIRMIMKENYVKAVYPSRRKMVTVKYDADNSQYVIESKNGSDVSENRINDYNMRFFKEDIIRSILLGG